ncbi:MAG: T9SS type A sorting domain-containing protein [Calditrichaceae bacterium]
MKYKTLLSIFLILFGLNQLFAQTSSLTLVWLANGEPDIAQYRVYRGVNSTTDLKYHATVTHPDTTFTDDQNITPGDQYAYGVCAVDVYGNQSNMSEVVSVALPKIDWTMPNIYTNQSTYVPLQDFLSDRDNDLWELSLEISQLNHLEVTQSGSELILQPSPATYTGPAGFALKVQDPYGFWDTKLIQIDITSVVTGIGDDPFASQIPDQVTLLQNYPNPFNPTTRIKFGLPESGIVRIDIFDVTGKKIKTLFDGNKEAGYHEIQFAADNIASGIYFYRIQANNFQEMKRMILMK